MKRSIAVEIISLLFTLLFLYTGISKLSDYNVFKEQIALSPLPESLAPRIAWGLPRIELLLALLLFIPRWRLKALYASLSLMLLFTGYIIATAHNKEDILCNCGGILEQMSFTEHIIFNSIFLLLAVFGILLEKQLKKQKILTWKTLEKTANLA